MNSGSILPLSRLEKFNEASEQKGNIKPSYLSSLDRIRSCVWFEVVCAEKLIKFAMYLQRDTRK